MGELFSTLTKQVLGVFLVSAGVPAVALVVGVRLLVAPELPVELSSLVAPTFLEAEWQAALTVVAVVVAASLLMSLNGPITRLYEGYPLERSRLGAWLRRRHEARVREAEGWWTGSRAILRATDRILREGRAGETGLDRDRIAALDAAWNRVGQVLPKLYPRPRRVLPTRLGNAIRAFEDYPRDKYGIYAVTLWPRLLAVVEEREVERIGSAKQPLDFMLNSSVVSGVLALLVLTSGLVWPQGRDGALAWTAWAFVVAALLVLAWGCYRLAIPQAVAWGETVKATFDLCRWDLLDRLRIAERPESTDEERKLWLRIGGHMLFGRMATYGPLRYAHPEASTESGAETGGDGGAEA